MVFMVECGSSNLLYCYNDGGDWVNTNNPAYIRTRLVIILCVCVCVRTHAITVLSITLP